MKKVLIASYNLGFGGIETSLINLLKNFNYDKYDVTLVLEKKEGVFLKQLPSNIKIKEYKTNNFHNVLIRKMVNLFKRIKWLIFNYKKYDVSICYATYSGPCGFVTRTSSNNKILYVHSNYYEAYNKDENKTKEFFDNLYINKYNHVVFVSNESKKDLIKIYPMIKDKSVVINNLVDYERIIKLSKEKIDLKKDENKIFLFVGRLDESSKKLTNLIDVARLCSENKVRVNFWIVGNGPDEKKYKDLVNKYKIKNVTFFGPKKNPYPYISAADYLILTSKYEGFPVVYNEAIILNKFILTTIDVSDDYVAIPDRFGIITKNNVSDIYENVKKLSKKLVRPNDKVDFKKINEKRIRKLEEIMESKDD